MNDQTEKLVTKIYEQTHQKIEPDDPILTLLIAQQILIDELTNNLSDIQDEEQEKIQKMYQIAFDKSAVIASDMADTIKREIKNHLQETLKAADAKSHKEFDVLSRKLQMLSVLIYICIAVNACLIAFLIKMVIKAM